MALCPPLDYFVCDRLDGIPHEEVFEPIEIVDHVDPAES
jgi:hypothetical protein